MEWLKGFDPVIDKNSKVLILGSFPSVKSREQGFYYANKQNRMWKVLENATKKIVPNDALQRREFLLENNIAMWDVVKECKIIGSSDSDIKEENSVAVAFDKVLNEYDNIKLIICNGKKAHEIFIRFNPDKSAICLPSTSSANGRFNMQAWIDALEKVLK